MVSLHCVEFALHTQHETFRDCEIQTKEDFKSKSRKRLTSLSTVSGNINDWYEYWNTQSHITEWTEFQENEVGTKQQLKTLSL